MFCGKTRSVDADASSDVMPVGIGTPQSETSAFIVSCVTESKVISGGDPSQEGVEVMVPCGVYICED